MTKVKIILDDLTDDRPMRSPRCASGLIWNDFDRLSASGFECDAMDSATIKLRRALAEAGFDPR
jgi:hypothetical protein